MIDKTPDSEGMISAKNEILVYLRGWEIPRGTLLTLTNEQWLYTYETFQICLKNKHKNLLKRHPKKPQKFEDF